MKCQKCGFPAKYSDKYCGNCGTKIVKENKFTKFLINNKLKLIITSIIIILLILIYNILNYLSSPTYVASKYFKAVINNDVKQIYETISLSDNDFMNINTLSKKIETYNNVTDIYIAKKMIINNEALITYSYRENNQLYNANVSLTKTGKKWLAFDNWEVNSGKIAYNITIKMPIGSTVTIDDIDLKKYLSKQENGYDIYEIDYMVDGQYTLKVKLLDNQEVTETIVISSNTEYTIDNINLSDEIIEDVTGDIENLMTDMYKNIIKGTSYDNINYNDKIKTLYKNLNYNYKNSYFTLTNIDFTDFSIINSRIKGGKLNVSYNVEYNYSINYTVNGEVKTYSGTNRGIISASYNYEDEYQINDIGNLRLNFPIRK